MLYTHDALENLHNSVGPERQDEICPCCGGWGDHTDDCPNGPPCEELIDAMLEALAKEAG